MATTFPKHLYVVAKKEMGKSNPLGFLNAYEPKKSTFETKKHAQHTWAYDYGAFNFRSLEVIGQDAWVIGTQLRYDGNRGTEIQFLPEFLPVIWHNDALTGFRVMHSVNRYTANIWRILDPRGYEFEITTASFDHIVASTDIHKGAIQGKCRWKSNKNLVVVD
jgi:hypothetical protein